MTDEWMEKQIPLSHLALADAKTENVRYTLNLYRNSKQQAH